MNERIDQIRDVKLLILLAKNTLDGLREFVTWCESDGRDWRRELRTRDLHDQTLTNLCAVGEMVAQITVLADASPDELALRDEVCEARLDLMETAATVAFARSRSPSRSAEASAEQ